MVELQLSKLIAWVRFPPPAPAGSKLAKVKKINGKWILLVFFPLFSAAHIAQSVEHFLGKEEVIGPIPIVGTS
jgi:hypothetical protein